MKYCEFPNKLINDNKSFKCKILAHTQRERERESNTSNKYACLHTYVMSYGPFGSKFWKMGLFLKK